MCGYVCVGVCVCVCVCECVCVCVCVCKNLRTMSETKTIKERKYWSKREKIENGSSFLHQIEPQAPLLVVPLSQKWPKQSQIIFSQHFDHYHLLDIIALCYHMQFQQNPMIFN